MLVLTLAKTYTLPFRNDMSCVMQNCPTSTCGDWLLCQQLKWHPKFVNQKRKLAIAKWFTSRAGWKKRTEPNSVWRMIQVRLTAHRACPLQWAHHSRPGCSWEGQLLPCRQPFSRTSETSLHLQPPQLVHPWSAQQGTNKICCADGNVADGKTFLSISCLIDSCLLCDKNA